MKNAKRVSYGGKKIGTGMDGESEKSMMMTTNLASYPPERKIFINNINSYVGFQLCQWILFSIDDFILLDTPNSKLFDDEDSDEEITGSGTLIESDNNQISESEDMVDGKKRNKYKIFGTLEKNELKYTNSISLDVEILNPNDDNFVSTVLECGIIIFNNNSESNLIKDADLILQGLEKYAMDLSALYGEEVIPKDKHRKFILISTIMTWAATKLDETTLTEEIYRKRLPHPCYVAHMTLEKNVINLQKRFRQSLRTLVVCPGVVYGGAEDIFHYLFKLAYLNSPEIDVFAPASNTIPVIYLKDFVRIIKDIIVKFPRRSLRYILAVQPQSIIYIEFARLVAKWVCGADTIIRLKQKYEMVFTEENALTHRVFAHLTLNLRIEPVYLAEHEFIISGELDNFGDALRKEYRNERGLKPIKILIAGPPCAGKSGLAKNLAEFYGLHIVPSEKILEETIRRYKIQRRKTTEYLDVLEGRDDMNIEEGEHEGENEEMESEQTELSLSSKFSPFTESKELKEKLKDELNEQLKSWDEKLADLMIMDAQVKNGEKTDFDVTRIVLQKRLYEYACSSNQGYILDGFPYEYVQADLIFGDSTLEEEADDEENEYDQVSKKYSINDTLKPEFVILLRVNYDLCCARAMAMTEVKAILTRNTEKEVLQKLQIYQDQCREDRSLLNYFLDRDIIPIEISVTEKTTQKELFEKLRNAIGEPRNYLLTQAELDEINRLEREQAQLEDEERERCEAEKWAAMEHERELKLQQWTDKFLRLKQEEQKLIELRSLPLRHYLMKYILPTLIKGLCEVIRCKPKDPIDFLAEFLFKFNTTGYMPPIQTNEEIKSLLTKNEIEVTQAENETDQTNFEEEFKFCLEEINTFLK